MCNPIENIKFCTCDDVEQLNPKAQFPGRKLKRDFYENEYLEVRLIWDLHHYIGPVEFDMVGMMYMPDKKLDNGLTEEFALDQLNNKVDLFDFDYTPQEGDALYIRSEYVYEAIKHKYRPHHMNYMAFIFRNEAWEADFHNGFSVEIEEFAKGMVETQEKDQ